MYRLSGDYSHRFYTYELIDPRTDVVFYVGKGSLTNGRTGRYRDHIRIARRGGRGRRFNLIRELLSVGLKPVQKIVLEEVTEDAAYAEERRLIQRYGLAKLTNVAPGGNGGPCDVQCGDNHWTRKYPEKVLKGETHPWNKDPALRQHCIDAMQAALKADPTKRPQGESHGMAKLTLARVTEIRDVYSAARAAGQTITGRNLAKLHGVTPKQVSRLLRGESWGLPSLIEKHGNAKLTPEQIASIPGMLASGMNQKQAAEALKVSHSLVNYYAKRTEAANV